MMETKCKIHQENTTESVKKINISKLNLLFLLETTTCVFVLDNYESCLVLIYGVPFHYTYLQ